MENLKLNQRVLYVWKDIADQNELVKAVEKINSIVGTGGKVALENADKLAQGNLD